MDKLRFEFMVKADEDPKTNVICVISVTNVSKQTFLFPDKFQPVKLHDEISKTQTFLKMKNTLQKRHDKRHAWISMTPEIKKVYIDDDGNMQFKEYLLEECTSETEQQGYADGFSQENKISMILSDQYPGLNSKEFKTFLDKENIQLVFTAVNSPFSNGLNERLNQTLVNKIRCKLNEGKQKLAWTTIAHECAQRYNETEHTVTGFSPKYLMEGKNVDMIPDELKHQVTHNDLLENRKIALKNTLKSHEYNKQLFDKRRNKYELKEGDLVYVENGNRLNRKKIGPYKIIEKLSNSIYRLNTGH